ncbi:MAG: hypothetical protein WAZ77_12360 [Candidatus Nitrosopolaris sp.]
MTKKNTVKCCWKRPNQYWDILVLIGHSTETGEKQEVGVCSKGGSSKSHTD